MKPAIYILLLIALLSVTLFFALCLTGRIKAQQSEITRLQGQLDNADRDCVSKAGKMILNHKREFHAGLSSADYMEVE